MTTRLDVSIGPVQAFVSQSRRTRDLWGSSFLLAFLTAHAMRGAEQAGGRIAQPVVDGDALYAWVCGDRRGRPPRIGTVPNHFVVEVSGAAGPIAKAAEQALGEAWMTVCRSVWERFVAHACPTGRGTDAIWKRQIESFWDVTWTAGPGNDGARLMARRKQWRTHRPPDEPGDKCTVMHDLQEISGHVGVAHRARQKEFWMQVGSRLGSLDLQAGERLCAIALVKRLFPKQEVCGAALGWPVDASHWRSTVSIGALPWIREVMEAVPQQAREYAQVVSRHVPDVFMERPPSTGRNVETAGAFARLDANYLHCDFVASERRCPLSADATQADRDELGALLKKIYDAETEDGRRLGPPPAFYALLLADGDRMGDLVGRLDGLSVSRALASFTGKVTGIVEGHHGVTVYAGGDDVLAMLPAAGALQCAECTRGVVSGRIRGDRRREPSDSLGGRGIRPRASAATIGAPRGAPPARRRGEGWQWTQLACRRRLEAWRATCSVGHHLDARGGERRARRDAHRRTGSPARNRHGDSGTLVSAPVSRPETAHDTLWLGPLATGRVAQRSRRSRSPPVPPCRDRSQPRRADGVPDR